MKTVSDLRRDRNRKSVTRHATWGYIAGLIYMFVFWLLDALGLPLDPDLRLYCCLVIPLVPAVILTILFFGIDSPWPPLGAVFAVVANGIFWAIISVCYWAIFRRPRTHPRGHCHSCGYDLTGNASGTCPECGTDTNPPPTKDNDEPSR